jgi:hypothetical protein
MLIAHIEIAKTLPWIYLHAYYERGGIPVARAAMGSMRGHHHEVHDEGHHRHLNDPRRRDRHPPCHRGNSTLVQQKGNDATQTLAGFRYA